MDEDLRKFVNGFSTEILERAMGAEEADSNFRETAFTELVMEHLEEYGVTEGPHLAFHEGRIGRYTTRVNGFAVNEEEDTVDLFASVFLDAGEPKTVPGEDLKRAVEQAAYFFLGTGKGIHKNLEPASEAFAMASRIHELGGRITHVRIFILTDGIATKKELADREISGIRTSFQIWDIERLFRILQSGRQQDEIVIDFIQLHGSPLPFIRVPADLPDYSACLAILPGEVLFRMYDQFGPRLLERNVRAFLQARGKVNKGIRNTLKNEPTRFLAYNNGISVTVESLVTAPLPDGGQGIASAKGLQIVNGGQTTASIHRAKRYDKADISQVFVPVKITELHPDLLDEFAPRIAEYANTQNVVQMADFPSVPM